MSTGHEMWGQDFVDSELPAYRSRPPTPGGWSLYKEPPPYQSRPGTPGSLFKAPPYQSRPGTPGAGSLHKAPYGVFYSNPSATCEDEEEVTTTMAALEVTTTMDDLEVTTTMAALEVPAGKGEHFNIRPASNKQLSRLEHWLSWELHCPQKS